MVSLCQKWILKQLNRGHFKPIIENALAKDEWLQSKNIIFSETEALFLQSGGDARKLLNILEQIIIQTNSTPIIINNESTTRILQQKTAMYDKGGEEHYNIISAFIKSLRGSDPNAAIYYLARMLDAGESIEFIARRILILASEDIGNANPNALLLATNCFQAIQMIGMPEARIILSQTVIYLATSVKSNASYLAIDEAMSTVKKTGNLPVPLHLRNAPTELMRDLNYGSDYQYAHLYENNFIMQEFLPDGISGQKFYEPGNNARENEQRLFLKNRWKEKYGY